MSLDKNELIRWVAGVIMLAIVCASLSNEVAVSRKHVETMATKGYTQVAIGGQWVWQKQCK